MQVRPETRELAIVTTLAAALTGGALWAAPGPDAAPGPTSPPRIEQTTFKSVDATIAAQWEFPSQTPAPLVVLVPGGGRLDRNGWMPGMGEDADHGIYADLAKRLVNAGFAVFRYDKPGAGRSSPGQFATERSNALEAYTRAVDHARIDADRVFLLGHGIGTDTIAGIYPRFAAVVAPAGVVLLDNLAGENDSLRIEAPTLIVNSSKDPDDHFQYGEFVAEARRKAEGRKLPTDLVLLGNVERGLLAPDTASDEPRYMLDRRAIDAVVHWLMVHRG